MEGPAALVGAGGDGGGAGGAAGAGGGGPSPAAPRLPPPRLVVRWGAGVAGALTLASAAVASAAAGVQLRGGGEAAPAGLALAAAGLQLARLAVWVLAAVTQWRAGSAARRWAKEEARLGGSLNLSSLAALSGSLRGIPLSHSSGTPPLSGGSQQLPWSAGTLSADIEGVSRHFSSRETAARGSVQGLYRRLNMVLDFEFLFTAVGLVPVTVVYSIIAGIELERASCTAPAADVLSIASLVLCGASVLARMAGGPMPLQWRPLLGTGAESQLVWEAHYMGRVEQWLREVMLFMGAPKYYWFCFSKSNELGAAAHPVAMGAAKIFTTVRAERGTPLLEFLSVLNTLRKEDTVEEAMVRQQEGERMTREDLQVGRWSVNRSRGEKGGLPPIFSGRELPDDPDLRLTVAIQEAASMVRFSTACYSGIQLDLLRHKKSFLYFFLRRQEIFWTLLGFSNNRSVNPASDPTGEALGDVEFPSKADSHGEKKGTPKKKILTGDNPWQGNARAFCRYAHIPMAALRGGRIGKRKLRAEAFNLASGLLAYFISVVQETRCVVVAVRGTGDLNDVLLDLSAYEIAVTAEDLGIPAASPASNDKRLGWAHFGVLNAVRELTQELTGDDLRSGPLNDLLGPGGECEGWDLRIVGQSLGGAVAGLLALRLRQLYPAVRGICYNPLPVLDSQAIAAVGADICHKHCMNVTYANDVVSRLTFPAVARVAERIQVHLCERKSKRRSCCDACLDCLRPYSWLSELGLLACGYCLFCMCHMDEDVDETVTMAGRAIVAQDYPYTAPGSASLENTPRGTPNSNPVSRSSSWKPKPLAMGDSFSKTPQIKLQKKQRSSVKKKPQASAISSSDLESANPEVKDLTPEVPLSRPAEFPRGPDESGTGPPQTGAGLPPCAFIGGHNRQTSFNSQYSNHSAKMQFSGPQFLLFGDIVHLQPIDPPPGSADVKERMWKASFKFPDDFTDISLADDFLSNHFPWHLEAALGWVCGQTSTGAGGAKKRAESGGKREGRGGGRK